jgi:6-phosphogluconolactonase
MVYKTGTSNFEAFTVSFLVKTLKKLQKTQSEITIALSGGSTPMPILKKLSQQDLQWNKLHFYMVDERCVPLESEQSNYGTIKAIFFNHISSNSYSMIKTGLSIEESILKYELDVKKKVEYKKGFPSFDLILLGLGEDGHTASLFPNTSALTEEHKIVVKNFVPQLNAERITLTYPVILNAKKIVVMFKGSKKTQIFEETQTPQGTNLPIQKIVDQRKDTNWIIQTP